MARKAGGKRIHGRDAWDRAATATELARIHVDTSEMADLAKFLEGLADQQLPFATALALTRVAKAARDRLRSELPRYFKIRNPNVTLAVQYKAASKRDHPPKSIVHTQPWAGFLTLHVTGGVKRAEGSGRIAVPTRIVVRTTRGTVKREVRPRPLRSSEGLEQQALEQRGRIVVHGVKAAPPGLSFFYTLVRGARIAKRWPFAETVTEVVRERLEPEFRQALDQAIQTAGRRRRAPGGF